MREINLRCDKVIPIPHYVNCKQGDDIKFTFEMYNNGTSQTLTGYNFLLKAKRPDKTLHLQDTYISVSGNKITVECYRKNDTLITQASGRIEIELQLIDSNNNLFSTFNIGLICISSVLSNEASSNSNTILEALENSIAETKIAEAKIKEIVGLADYERFIDDVNIATSKSTVALAKAENPLSSIVASGYRIKPEECSRDLLDLINGSGTVNIGQGLLVNQGEEYPLKRVVINGSMTSETNSLLKSIILDVQVINAKHNKTYQIDWIGNGYTNFGENAKYGIRVCDYDTDVMETTTGNRRTLIDYKEFNFPTPSGIVTRKLTSKVDDVVVVVTLDYSKFGSNLYISTTAIGTCVIHENCYIYTTPAPKSINLIKGIDYPLRNYKNSTNAIHNDIKQGLIDVKVINAKRNKKYKIEYIGNGTTGFGIPEYAIYLAEYDLDMSTTNRRYIFDRNNAHLDAPTNQIETRTITVDGEPVILIVTIDYSKLTGADKYSMNTVGGAGYDFIIDENCYFYETNVNISSSNDTDNYDVAVAFNEVQNISVKFPYTDTTTAIMTYGQLGVNKITHFKNFSTCNEKFVSLNFADKSSKFDISSDWLSPYGIKVTTNEVTTNAFTVGGNHGTDGGNGLPTSESISTQVFVDGQEIQVGEIKGAKTCVEILTKNYIYGSNTINLSTGSHRNSVIETVLHKIYKDTINITVTLEALEPISLNYYTGMQTTALPLSMITNLYFMLENTWGDYKIADYTGKAINSCKKSEGIVDRFVLYGKNDTVIAYKDKFIGLSTGSQLRDTDVVAYKSTGTKTYLHNIHMGANMSVPLNTNEVAYWSGGYTFTGKGLNCNGSKRAYTIREKGKRVYCIDFDKAINDITYVETFIEDRGKFINIVHKTDTITCDNFITSRGLKINCTGYGQLKFTVE